MIGRCFGIVHQEGRWIDVVVSRLVPIDLCSAFGVPLHEGEVDNSMNVLI